MLWKGRRQSDNVEDQRGEGGGGLPGGFGGGGGPGRIRIPIGGSSGRGGLGGIIILVILFFALKACGIDPLEILAGGDGSSIPGGGGQVTQSEAPSNDETTQFMRTVLASSSDDSFDEETSGTNVVVAPLSGCSAPTPARLRLCRLAVTGSFLSKFSGVRCSHTG